MNERTEKGSKRRKEVSDEVERRDRGRLGGFKWARKGAFKPANRLDLIQKDHY